MKKLLVILAVSLAACAAPTAEEVLSQYSEALKTGRFESSLWDLKEFAQLYYAEYWNQAEKADQDKLVSLIEKFAGNVAVLQKNMAAAAEVKKMEVIEKTDSLQRIKVLYVSKINPKATLEITYLMKLQGRNWKIINYEKLAFSNENVIEPVPFFKRNFPQFMKDAGIEPSQISVKVINQFLEEKVIKPAEEAAKK